MRTNEIIGESEELPKIGEPFTLISDPLTIPVDAGKRFFSTSIVVGIDKASDKPDMTAYCTIHTLNSTYEITLIETVERK